MNPKGQPVSQVEPCRKNPPRQLSQSLALVHSLQGDTQGVHYKLTVLA